MGRRAGFDISLDDFDRIGREVPGIAHIRPNGDTYLMEDFFYAGGLPAVIRELSAHLHTDALTVNGKTLGDNTADAQCYNRKIIAHIDTPFKETAGIAILRGNLCPDGAVIKPSAASPELMKHRGRAVVFEDNDEYKEHIDDPDLDIDATCILVLKGIGPKGFPGMPEGGNMGLPKKLLQQGVRDMVRISDGRMSGTAYGTVVLHVAPEAAVGGTLALVQNGDMIELDVEQRRLTLDVPDAVLERRRQAWTPPAIRVTRGYAGIYVQHVQQANKGADLDILVGSSGSAVTRKFR